MKIPEFNRDAARIAFEQWSQNGRQVIIDNEEYNDIRKKIVEIYKSTCIGNKDTARKDYIRDVIFGIKFYSYLSSQSWFNLRTAANDGFWRYLSVNIIPDIVAERWGGLNDIYFWKQSNRLWPKTIWWYIHLSKSGTLEETQIMLQNKNFNTDMIQGLVERTGKKGVYVEVYREIMKQYALLDFKQIVKFKKKQVGTDSLFRAIMRLNTARTLVVDPCLCKDGVEGYVKSLIDELIN